MYFIIQIIYDLYINYTNRTTSLNVIVENGFSFVFVI